MKCTVDVLSSSLQMKAGVCVCRILGHDNRKIGVLDSSKSRDWEHQACFSLRMTAMIIDYFFFPHLSFVFAALMADFYM